MIRFYKINLWKVYCRRVRRR